MTMTNRMLVTAIAAALASTAAQAITYGVSLPVGIGSATGSITTDGTIGTLETSNIVDWSLDLNDGFDTLTLDGATNSQLEVWGTKFSATSTGLFFDFSSMDSAYVLFQSPSLGIGINYLCLDNASGACSLNQSVLSLRLTGSQVTSSPFVGNSLVAGTSSVGGAVPEPASWAMLIAGFGLVGAVARRRAARFA